ncbi:G1/S-specific cyclin-E1 [Nowakowskiella sp. JEL0078]|nr:G1/S-specific cyclin-E1 [Nowakowskiella sp. JEL0078]
MDDCSENITQVGADFGPEPKKPRTVSPSPNSKRALKNLCNNGNIKIIQESSKQSNLKYNNLIKEYLADTFNDESDDDLYFDDDKLQPTDEIFNVNELPSVEFENSAIMGKPKKKIASSLDSRIKRFRTQISDQKKYDLDLHIENWKNMVKQDNETYRTSWIHNFDSFDDQTRYMLVSWLCLVASENGFRRRTFHLAVHFLDTLCSHYASQSALSIDACEFQLLGTTMLYTAMKCEELIICPLAYLVDFLLPTQQAHLTELPYITAVVREMEIQLINNVSLIGTTAYDFLLLFHENLGLVMRASPSEAADALLKDLVVVDMVVSVARSLEFKNSVLAASIMWKNAMDIDVEILEIVTGVEKDELSECLEWLCRKCSFLDSCENSDISSLVSKGTLYQSAMVATEEEMFSMWSAETD